MNAGTVHLPPQVWSIILVDVLIRQPAISFHLNMSSMSNYSKSIPSSITRSKSINNSISALHVNGRTRSKKKKNKPKVRVIDDFISNENYGMVFSNVFTTSHQIKYAKLNRRKQKTPINKNSARRRMTDIPYFRSDAGADFYDTLQNIEDDVKVALDILFDLPATTCYKRKLPTCDVNPWTASTVDTLHKYNKYFDTYDNISWPSHLDCKSEKFGDCYNMFPDVPPTYVEEPDLSTPFSRPMSSGYPRFPYMACSHQIPKNTPSQLTIKTYRPLYASFCNCTKRNPPCRTTCSYATTTCTWYH
ncbi:hypothetical protein CHUAL_012617 [Chamberlinius hualienensis]